MVQIHFDMKEILVLKYVRDLWTVEVNIRLWVRV